MQNRKIHLIVAFNLLLLAGAATAGGASGVEKAVGLYQSMMKAPDGETSTALDAENKACLRDELAVSKIEEDLLLPIKQAILSGDRVYLDRLQLGEVEGLRRGKVSRTVGSIAESPWDAKGRSSLAAHVASFGEIAYVELKAEDFFVDSASRAKDGSFSSAEIRARLDLRGKQGGKLAQDRAVLLFGVKKEQGGWRITGLRASEGRTLVQNGRPAFTESTAEAGLDKASVYLRTEAIRRGGYALSVADVNGDGLQDIFLGNRESPELWMGKKDGRFERAAENPFRDERYTKTAVFADFNNDGRQDVVITRFNEKKGEIRGVHGPALDVVVYENQDGKFVLRNQSLTGEERLREPMPAAVADFNGDGYLDFYVGYPGKQDFSLLSPDKTAPLGQVQGLYLNDRKGFFKDFTASAFGSKADYQGRIFPHSSFAADFNQDGHQDLMVADDRGNLSPLFMNAGGGRFRERSEPNGIANRGFSMSIAAGDVENRGRTDLVVTNVSLTEFDRLRSACHRHFGRDRMLAGRAAGLRVFQIGKDGKYEEKTGSMITDHPGEATAGMTFLDYNNDGFQDLYVVNGLWSGTPDGQDLGSFFTSLMGGVVNSLYAFREADSAHFMEVLSQLKGRIQSYADAGSVKAGKDRPSLGGYQRNRLYRNNGNGTFTEVGFLEGVDSMADGYVVARADLNRDGRMDLVLRNGDPGTSEHRFPVAQIFRNQGEDGNKSVTLEFTGSRSNRDGFGLFAKATIGKTTRLQHMAANSGSAQEQRLLHFGLGKHGAISRLEIHWPSGGVQVLKNVKPGYHQIMEPSDIRPAKAAPASLEPVAFRNGAGSKAN